MEKTGTHVLQNNAYDFAYSKEEDFRSRGWGHLELFAWGGISGAYQEFAWSVPQMFGTQLFYQGIEWSVNGAIKNRYKGIKTSGSQVNKAGLNYFKWIFRTLSEFN